MIKYQLLLVPTESTPAVKVYLCNQLLDALAGMSEKINLPAFPSEILSVVHLFSVVIRQNFLRTSEPQ